MPKAEHSPDRMASRVRAARPKISARNCTEALGLILCLSATACLDLRDVNERPPHGLDSSADSDDASTPSPDVATASDAALGDNSADEIAAPKDAITGDANVEPPDAPGRIGDPDADGVPEAAQADARHDDSSGPSIDGGDKDGSDSCVSSCDAIGAFRCSGPTADGPSRQIQVCSMTRGCLEWLDTATCGDEEMCCVGACRPVTSDAACEGDYFVDAQNGRNDADAGSELGTQANPFRTVTFAIDRAQRAMTVGKRIHVAAGHYDEALGERLPLVLRNGTSLFGAGPDLVTLQGTGQFDHSGAGGPYNKVTNVTIVAGDSRRPTIISGMTVRASSTTPATYYDGIVCDLGNASASASLAGVTLLDNMVVGPGYADGIVATCSTFPDRSACKLHMTRSLVTSGWWGLVAVGQPAAAGNPRLPVSLQIGDENDGNTFSWLNNPNNFGGAILAYPAVTESSIRRNLFTDCGHGVLIDQRDEAGVGLSSFKINNNDFTRLSVAGVYVWSESSALEELSDNTFTNISASNVGDTTSTAWGLAANGNGSSFPPIKKARRNRFIGNDAAVVFGTSLNVLFDPSGPIDFGRADDPGGNVFRCNSMPSGVGGDVLMSVSGTGSIPFVGNAWDHSPVTTGTNGSAVNGTDIIFFQTPPPRVDTNGATIDSTNCPVGRLPGP